MQAGSQATPEQVLGAAGLLFALIPIMIEAVVAAGLENCGIVGTAAVAVVVPVAALVLAPALVVAVAAEKEREKASSGPVVGAVVVAAFAAKTRGPRLVTTCLSAR